MNLLLLEPAEGEAAGDIPLSDARADHLRKILRVRVGDRIRVGIVDGPLGHAEVVAMNEREIRLRAVFEAETPPRPCVSLLLAMPRPKALKRLWAPLAAAGVDAIFVLPAERVERMYFDSDALHPALIRSRLIEGLAQAADTRLPRVEIRRRLRPFLEDEGEPLWRDARRLLAHPGNAPRVADRVRPGERVWLAVGAEGGWTPYERELWRAHGFEEVSMGPRAWRSGPACLALIALAQDARRREMGMPVVEKEAE